MELGQTRLGFPTAIPLSIGKGRRPLYSLWDGQRLDYIAARKQIYLPLYQKAVAQTSAYRRLESTYRRSGSITLFDFDGYDHAALNMTLADVLNCKTRICGHAFILAMMLTYGADFKLSDLESIPTTEPAPIIHAITVVNVKSFAGPAEYIGRPMPGRKGSPLGNPYKIKPWGQYDRDESVLIHYRAWLWKELQKQSGEVYRQKASIDSGLLVCASYLPRRNNKERDHLPRQKWLRRVNRE